MADGETSGSAGVNCKEILPPSRINSQSKFSWQLQGLQNEITILNYLYVNNTVLNYFLILSFELWTQCIKTFFDTKLIFKINNFSQTDLYLSFCLIHLSDKNTRFLTYNTNTKRHVQTQVTCFLRLFCLFFIFWNKQKINKEPKTNVFRAEVHLISFSFKTKGLKVYHRIFWLKCVLPHNLLSLDHLVGPFFQEHPDKKYNRNNQFYHNS